MKDLSVKKIVLSSIAFLTAFFTLIGLAFKVVAPISGFFFIGHNAYYYFNVEEWVAILGQVYAIIHMIYGLVGIVLVVIAFFLFSGKTAQKVNKIFVIGGLVFSILYMTLGITFASLYAVPTQAYGQFILIALCFTAYFVCNAVLKETPLGGRVIKSSQASQTVPVVKSVKQEKSSIDLLMEYKKLLDAGIITQEEFEAKKSELL